MSPRYPIYVPSKGRAERLKTAKMFDRHGVDYRVVVEPSQVEAYGKAGYAKRLLVLPEDGQGLVYSRNWITERSRELGEIRHWQVDDDCSNFYRVMRGYRLPCHSGVGIAVAEDFADRYENVALLCFNYLQFVSITRGGPVRGFRWPPFFLNHRCYTWILFLNALPYRWRPPNNEDADMTLQVLAGGWCTILLNAFLIKTEVTMKATGGQTEAFRAGARLKMVRGLERRWPGVVKVGRRFNHPQHVVAGNWSKFDNQLRLKPGVDPAKLGPNEYGMKIEVLRKVRNKGLARMVSCA